MRIASYVFVLLGVLFLTGIVESEHKLLNLLGFAVFNALAVLAHKYHSTGYKGGVVSIIGALFVTIATLLMYQVFHQIYTGVIPNRFLEVFVSCLVIIIFLVPGGILLFKGHKIHLEKND